MSTETTNAESMRRLPWVAVALSFLSAGVGHIYCGKIFKGLLLYFSWFIIPFSVSIGALLPPSFGTLVGFVLIPTVAVTAIYFYAARDAYSIARAAAPNYQLKDYNRPAIYWLLILVELVYPIGLTIGAREYVFEAFVLPTKSMAPSFLPGDRILVNKLASRKAFPERGDAIVFRNPEPDGGRVFIKRVIAVAGDHVVINGDIVEVNGTQLERVRVPVESLESIRKEIDGDVYYELQSGVRYQVMLGGDDTGKHTGSTMDIVVPRRSVFVMGDNRRQSKDSRDFGAIHVGDVIGYIDYLYWPAESWSRFGQCRD